MITKWMWSLLMIFALVSCVDLDHDEPPAGGHDPNLPVNTTIDAVKAMHVLGQFEEITDDLVFDAIVVSSDKAGNYFKQLVLQDETGGIEIRIDMTDMHNVYPIGRKVYVKAKGLWLGDYNGLIQLGGGVGLNNSGQQELVRIPESIIDQYLVVATYGNAVSPKILTLDNLSLSDVSTLVQLDGVQFIGADAGQTYADAVLQQSLNRQVEDCAKRRLIVRTSGFASFAGTATPQGNGKLVGILSIFRDDYQLMIRDVDDVDMPGERCSSGGGTLTIAALRAAFTGSTTPAPQGSIKGIVISDRTSQSVVGQNLYIQDATGGIVLRFTGNHNFSLGAEITVDVSGGTLASFNGLLQLEGLTTGSAVQDGTPGDVTPRVATVIEVLNNAQEWESTLVQLKDVVLGDNSTYSGSVTVRDATGTMILFTRNQASFASTPLPTGQVTLTAIVSEFNTPQLIMRNANDVTGGGSGGGDINETFSSVPNNIDIALPGWANIAVKGARLWRAQVFSGNTYAQATSFNDTANEMEAWLITPAIDLSEAKKLTFESAYAFWVHDGLSVWISSDFNGTDVTGANWTQLTPTLAKQTDPEHEFIASGDVDLSGFSGSVRIGFRYIGSGPGGQTTSCRIDNVKVEKL